MNVIEFPKDEGGAFTFSFTKPHENPNPPRPSRMWILWVVIAILAILIVAGVAYFFLRKRANTEEHYETVN